MFENNFALVSGGGLYVQNLLILNICREATFRNNIAKFQGGALDVREGSNVTISRSSFVDNHGTNVGGAASISNVQYLVLINCMFVRNRISSRGNSGRGGGGAVAVIGLRSMYVTTVVIKGSLQFKDNHADGSGGGLYVQSVIFRLNAQRCNFEGNTASKRGGALAVMRAPVVSIQRAIFFNNSCPVEAGAVSLYMVERVIFTDVQFINNYAGADAGASFISGEEKSLDSNIRSKAKVTFLGQTLFLNNRALGNGGGLCAEKLVIPQFHLKITCTWRAMKEI